MIYASKAEWEAEGRRRFGDDLDAWRFVCPRCGRAASVTSTKAEITPEEHERLRAGKYRIEAECIGRYLGRLGCDWAAYGLFRGPAFVVVDGKEIPVFNFAADSHP